MTRQNINLVSTIVPIVMSGLAFVMVLGAVATGQARHETDEGTAAHLFQLLIVLQAPFILAFLATTDWRRIAPALRPLAFQAAAIALAIGSVVYFRL